MTTLFIRTIIVYLVIFAVLRIMGKRQISDMQPFDLIVTLMIADVASVPLSDVSIPLFYGILPLLALFIFQRLVAFGALKSRRLRNAVCGKPVVVIADGIVLEDAMRAARCTLDDLMEQLRIKDVFSISEVEYGILETNGSLSVLPADSSDKKAKKNPSVLLVSDGRLDKEALAASGIDKAVFCRQLENAGLRIDRLFFASLESNGSLHVQEKQNGSSAGVKTHDLKAAVK